MSCEGDKFFLSQTAHVFYIAYVIIQYNNNARHIISLPNIKYYIDKIPDQFEQERNRNFCSHYMWFLCRLFCKCTGNSPHHMHAQPNTVVIKFIYDHHQGYYRIINFMPIIYLHFDQRQLILKNTVINFDQVISLQYFLFNMALNRNKFIMNKHDKFIRRHFYISILIEFVLQLEGKLRVLFFCQV